MSGSAIAMMVVGIGIIWGGLLISVWHALKKSKQTN